MTSAVWTDIKRLAGGLARDRQRLGLNLAVLLAVSGFVPWMIGLSFLDPLVLIPFCGLSVFFVAILIPQSMSEDRPQNEAALVIRIAAIVLLSWIMGLLTLVCALGTLNALHWHGLPLVPSWEILTAAAGFGLSATLTMACVGAAVTLGSDSAAAAQRLLRYSLMAVILFLLLGYPHLPSAITTLVEGDLTNAGIAKKTWVVTVVLLAPAAWSFQTARIRLGDR
jgi:hypothetical protein